MKTPIFYAQVACETLMRRYQPEDLPPKGHFHYHQGVFLSGLLKTAKLCGEESYWQYAAKWLRSVISPDGKILDYMHADLDDIQPGIILLALREHDCENTDFYDKALASVLAQVEDIPRCECGGFYHKVALTQQMWLDGLYMTCPFLCEYARQFQRPDLADLAVQEIFLMYEHTHDAKTGLWHHAWDESRQADWADPRTGLSPEFWGRSLGWVPVAILDVLKWLPEEHPKKGELVHLVQELLESISHYQSEDGRWYQILDKGGEDGNWLENSCSCLFSAAFARAVRMGILGEESLETAFRAFEGVTDSLKWEQEDLLIGNVCVGTGVGDYDFYCARPTCVNDLHGVGAFLLMCAELESVKRQ